MTFDSTVFQKPFDDAIHHLATFIDMGVFSTAKQNGDLNLIVVFQKSNGLFDFEGNVVFARLGSDSDLLQPCLVRLVLGLFFLFVVVEFSKVDDLANRRFGIRSNFDEIQPGVTSFVQSFLRRDHSQLITFLVNHTNWRLADLIIDSGLFFVTRLNRFTFQLNRILKLYRNDGISPDSLLYCISYPGFGQQTTVEKVV